MPHEDRQCSERDGNQRHKDRRAAIPTCQPYRCYHADWRNDQERYDKRKAQGDADVIGMQRVKMRKHDDQRSIPDHRQACDG